MIQVKQKLGLSGEFRCILYNEDMSVAQDTGWFPNLITDNGLDLLGEIDNWGLWMCIGDSATTPVIGNTTLNNFTASHDGIGLGNGIRTYDRIENPGAGDYWWAETRSRRFEAGTGTGTVAELSLGPVNDGTNIFNHSLITPSSITKAANQILDVIYRLTVWPPTGDVAVNNINVNGDLFDTLTRGCEYDQQTSNQVYNWFKYVYSAWPAFDGAIGATVELSPSGSQTSSGTLKSSVTGPYVPGSYELEGAVVCKITGWNSPSGLGVRCIRWATGHGSFQTQFTGQTSGEPLAKDDGTEMSFSVKTMWGRV